MLTIRYRSREIEPAWGRLARTVSTRPSGIPESHTP
jgi:hypothetical protein